MNTIRILPKPTARRPFESVSLDVSRLCLVFLIAKCHVFLEPYALLVFKSAIHQNCFDEKISWCEGRFLILKVCLLLENWALLTFFLQLIVFMRKRHSFQTVAVNLYFLRLVFSLSFSVIS